MSKSHYPRLEAKIQSYTIQGEPDECWKWSKSHYGSGYGQVALPVAEFKPVASYHLDPTNKKTYNPKKKVGNPRTLPVSRALMMLRAGRELDTKMEHACHTCNNKWCCNPAHIYIGTHIQNVADKVARNPQSGARNSGSKLTQEGVDGIRRDYAAGGVTQKQLADRNGVTQQSIGRIIRNERWVQ